MFMKFNKYLSVVGLLTIALMTGAGSCQRGNGQAGATPTNPFGGGFGPGGQIGGCMPGQNCVNGGTVLNGPLFASIDIYGSGQALLMLQLGNGGFQGGAGMGGNVVVQGQLQMYSGCNAFGFGMILRPGTYPVQGSGVWEPGYGGGVGRLAAQLQMMGYGGGSISIEPTMVRYGSTGVSGQGYQGFYMNPFGRISSCGSFGPVNVY